MFQIYIEIVINSLLYIQQIKKDQAEVMVKLEAQHSETVAHAIKSVAPHLRKENSPPLCKKILNLQVGEYCFLELAIKQIFSTNDLKAKTKLYIKKEQLAFLQDEDISAICNRITADWDGSASLSIEESSDDMHYCFAFQLC